MRGVAISAMVYVASSALAGPTPVDAGAVERPRPCARSEVRSVVQRYVTFFNRGSFRTLDRRVFAAEPEFRWYSTGGPGERLGRAAQDRSTLIAHLRRRWRAGDRLELTSLDVNSNSRPSGEAPWGNFEYELVRSPGEKPRQGKGAVYCYRDLPDRIFVWSMGDAGSGRS